MANSIAAAVAAAAGAAAAAGLALAFGRRKADAGGATLPVPTPAPVVPIAPAPTLPAPAPALPSVPPGTVLVRAPDGSGPYYVALNDLPLYQAAGYTVVGTAPAPAPITTQPSPAPDPTPLPITTQPVPTPVPAPAPAPAPITSPFLTAPPPPPRAAWAPPTLVTHPDAMAIEPFPSVAPVSFGNIATALLIETPFGLRPTESGLLGPEAILRTLFDVQNNLQVPFGTVGRWVGWREGATLRTAPPVMRHDYEVMLFVYRAGILQTRLPIFFALSEANGVPSMRLALGPLASDTSLVGAYLSGSPDGSLEAEVVVVRNIFQPETGERLYPWVTDQTLQQWSNLTSTERAALVFQAEAGGTPLQRLAAQRRWLVLVPRRQVAVAEGGFVIKI